VEEKKISRRAMLRNIGIAGAVAWAAPVLTSLPASAAPRGKAKDLCAGIDGNCNNGFTPCGTCSSDVGDGSFCFEVLNNKGKVSPYNYCTEDVFCAEAQPCSVGSDCPTGYKCITSNGCTGCGPVGGVCSKKCPTGLSGSPRPSRVQRLGRTASGR